MILATQGQVDASLRRVDHYRVVRAQEAAAEGAPDGISGALLLAFMIRETWGRNIEGGAASDGHGGYRPLRPDEYLQMDTGGFQISRKYHLPALKEMKGVAAGTWGPVVPGKTPAMAGYCPRFEEGMQYTIHELRSSMAMARAAGVPAGVRIEVAVAAHNAGQGGALAGWRAGNVDLYTAGGDYSRWVLDARRKVNVFLGQHPGWQYPEASPLA